MGRQTYYVSRLPFVVDPHTLVRTSGRRIDWSKLGESYRPDTVVATVKLAAGAAQADVALVTDPLPVAIPAGTLLHFGAGEFAKVTADAAAGAEALTVEAIPTALENDDEATYVVAGSLPKRVAAGSIMAQLSSGLLIPRAAVTGAETSTCILETDAVQDDDEKVGNSGYGCIVGGVLYADLLPDAAHASIATWKTELRAAGTGFVFEDYDDSRAS